MEVDWHDVDLRTYGAVSNAVKAIRPDRVYHLAAEGVTDPFLSPDAAIRANVYGTLHLLRAVGGRAPVVVTRTPGERDALNVYAASKAAAWEFCKLYRRTHTWPIAGAMLYQVYGPGQSPRAVMASAIAAALHSEDFPMTHGAQRRDWVFVADAVDALVRLGQCLDALSAAGVDTVDVGTGRATPVRDVVEAVYRMIDGRGKPLIGALQAAEADRTEALIGWRARTPLDDGLRETIQWTRDWLSQPAT